LTRKGGVNALWVDIIGNEIFMDCYSNKYNVFYRLFMHVLSLEIQLSRGEGLDTISLVNIILLQIKQQ